MAVRGRDADRLGPEVDGHRIGLNARHTTHPVRVVRDEVFHCVGLDDRLGFRGEGAACQMSPPWRASWCHYFQYAPRGGCARIRTSDVTPEQGRRRSRSRPARWALGQRLRALEEKVAALCARPELRLTRLRLERLPVGLAPPDSWAAPPRRDLARLLPRVAWPTGAGGGRSSGAAYVRSPGAMSWSRLCPAETRVMVGWIPALRVRSRTAETCSWSTIVTTVPDAPARAVRPDRCR